MLSAYPSQEGNKHADGWFESAVAERIGELLVIEQRWSASFSSLGDRG
jgi:hypothetical protein